jgi:2,3-bisphosphoglycerate-dependent phosphoglycerate mutase
MGHFEARMTQTVGRLVLVRHGQSTDNELNLFSGWRDPGLTERGMAEARAAGLQLKAHGFRFDAAFTSKLNRARHSLALMLDEMGETGLPVFEAEALNERDYGDLSGLNKEGAVAVWGREQVHLWRKSYRAIPPGGESLAMTAERTVPFCTQDIVPRLETGQQILVVAHGNSLRSIVKHLDGLSDDDVLTVHIATSQVLIYSIGAGGAVTGKTSFLAPSAG